MGRSGEIWGDLGREQCPVATACCRTAVLAARNIDTATDDAHDEPAAAAEAAEAAEAAAAAEAAEAEAGAGAAEAGAGAAEAEVVATAMQSVPCGC